MTDDVAEGPLPDYIDLFRIIRAAGRSDADKAKAVAHHLASIQEDYAIVPRERVNSEALAELIAMDADMISAAERTSQ